ncbi:MAG TPA: hypothetical protein V6C89_21675 [Drouetiella sp.]
MSEHSPLYSTVSLLVRLAVWVLFFLVLIVAFNAVAVLTGQPSGSTFASITLAALAGWLIALGCKYVESVRTPHSGWLYIPALLAIADAGLLASLGTIQFFNAQSSLLQVVAANVIQIMVAYSIALFGLPLIIRVTAESTHAAHVFMRDFGELCWKGATVAVAAAVSLLIIVSIHAFVAVSDAGNPLIPWAIAVFAFLQFVRYGAGWRKFYSWRQRSLVSKGLLIATILSVLWVIDIGLRIVMYANTRITVNSVVVFLFSAVMLDLSLIFGAPLLFILIAHPRHSMEENVSDEFGFETREDNEFVDNSDTEEADALNSGFGDNPRDEFADDDPSGGFAGDDDEFPGASVNDD